MNNENFTSLDEFDMNELSDEDLAVLHAFEAMNQWPTRQPQAKTDDQNQLSRKSQTSSPHDDEEMLLIFTAEAEEGITSIRQILNQLEHYKVEDLSRFITLKRAGHKLHGTAGAVGFPLISITASQIEILAEEVLHGTISPLNGIQAISAATTALEYCLHTMTSEGKEPETTSLLAELEATYRSVDIDLQQLEQKRTEADKIDLKTEEILQKKFKREPAPKNQHRQESVTREEETVAIHISPEDLSQGTSSIRSMPSTRVDTRRFEHLIVRTEKLVEQRAIVEEAQAQIECALQELYIAQARMKHLEPLIAKLQKGENVALSLPESLPASSLVARILHESAPIDRQRPLQKKVNHVLSTLQPPSSGYANAKLYDTLKADWDELEIDRYNEQDMLQHILKDAIADLAITTANVQSAFTRFSIIQQDYLAGITHVHRDTLLLHQAPFKSLVPRLERVVMMSAPGQARQIRFEVMGEDTEIDQDILDALAKPLVQLLRTCLTDPAILEEVRSDTPLKQESPQPRIWLKITNHGNRLLFEIGFSMPIQGGAIETIRQPIQQLHGTISLQRNSIGGISFFFRIPHPHSSVFCLLVRAGDQHLLIPFSQIEHIGDEQREHADLHYSLQELLGFPKGITTSHIFSSMAPLVMLASEDGTMKEETIGISVDEVLGEQECIVKPLPPYLQRPGIAGTTIDGKGRILLMIDLFALIRSAPQYTLSQQTNDNPLPQPHRASILVTDDSAALRHSLVQTLQHASYTVLEARDGVEALEKLQQQKPDICLLDVEMPNLNGYDVLELMATDPEMAKTKVIMLTSRSTVKHMQHALSLGASAYLTKPCSQDDLFQTIERALKKSIT
jgi:chemosensory pili system protein ChpA (sensor histidine kinase/response regulator)